MLDRLGPLGFRNIGKTIALFDRLNTVALIRIGGKRSQPGRIHHILCFRHSFLRDNLDQKVPTKVSLQPSDYPYKFLPSHLMETSETSWRYRPLNLNYEYDTIEWAAQRPEAIHAGLKRLSILIAQRFVPWAQALTPTLATAQIQRYGENAWCERMWLEDYSRFALQ